MSTLAWRCVAIIAAGVMLSLVGVQAVQADSDTTIFETLVENSVDSYLVTCPAGTTRQLHVQVCDEGGFDDTQFMVQVIGRTPTVALGKVMILTSPAGGCSSIGHFVRGATSGAMSVLLTVTERNNTGIETYSLFLNCEDKNFLGVGNITAVKKQDQ